MTDASFALFVNARVRLLRTVDGTAVYDAPMQFQSGTSLFVNWTFNNGVAIGRAADYGYRLIAEKTFAQLFAQSSR